MPLNTTPLRAISAEDMHEYQTNGVVCLRRVFEPEWLESMLPLAMRILIDKEDFGLLPTYPGRYMARRIPEFRRFVFESPVAEAAAQVIGSSAARFFFDEMFAKAPRSEEKTIWHTDRMGWPVSGHMVPSIWIPLTPIVEENSLEVIAGSHTQDVRYWLFSPNARKMVRPPDRVSHPDCEPLRKDPSVKFLRWKMAVGDMLVVHPWALHYSHGNPTDGWRVALSVRIFGDDIRWDPRPDCVNLAGVSFDEMIAGEKPQGPLFPVLWNAAGGRDDDSAFPRGFASTWTRERRGDVNEYALFQKNLADARVATASPSND